MTLTNLFKSTLGHSPECFQQVHQIKDDTRFVTFYRSSLTLLISFGPTLGDLYFNDKDIGAWARNGADWFRNFDIKKVGGVHEGFLREWESVEDEVRQQIADAKPSLLIITGFSQGSAHATLATRALSDLGIPIECHAFATPRVFGWVAGATYDNWLTVSKNITLTRYNHRRDPVQHSPFAWMGFAHVGHSVQFGPAGWWDMAKYHDPSAYITGLEII